MGHHSFACPGRRVNAADGLPNNIKVWRPIDRDKSLVPASSSCSRPSFPRRFGDGSSRVELTRWCGRVQEQSIAVGEHLLCAGRGWHLSPRPSSSLGVTTTDGGVLPDTGAEVGQEVRSRHRCRPQKRRASAHEHQGGQSEPALDVTYDQAPFMPLAGPHAPAPCILDWLGQMVRVEDLCRAVVITVINESWLCQRKRLQL
jgi:hypothetical protein